VAQAADGRTDRGAHERPRGTPMPAPAMAAALDPAVARADTTIARPRPPGARMTRRVIAAAAAALLLACIAMSLIEGRPRELPGVALGSVVLLYAERSLALVAVTVAALSIVGHAARGWLPIEHLTSGLRYEAEAVDDAAAAVAELQEQFDDLVAIVGALAERLDARQDRP
jgi:hypothetical protein